MKKGEILDSGFEILDLIDCEELNAKGILARHIKTGTEVFHILNTDPENLFAFAFATAAAESTGVAHILEHATLCGSRHFPLKDAFLILAQGSLQTYLNAWTFPDKTVYPASSVNETDYFNLMEVYGDAVFHPLLSEWTFMQEGHRLEYTGEDGKNKQDACSKPLTITGVVYNEMKGAYSALDAYAGLWSTKAVLPDTVYAFESGGDPECIPDLSYDDLKDFHKKRYCPANCRIFLAGNIPTEKQLKFLNEKFLSIIAPGQPAAPITKVVPWHEPRDFRIPCPSGAETKAQVILSWVCSDATDINENLALAALAETLLGHDGSPITRALVESGLGEDLSPVTGFELSIRQTVFCIGLRGLAEQSKTDAGKKVERLIFDELQRLVTEGIPQKEIEAALLTLEFSNREIRRAHGPYSLVWLQRSLNGWLHGIKPWKTLLFVPAFTELKRRLAENPRYFEGLIQKYFLDNKHRAFILLEPTEGFLEEKEKKLEEKLTRLDADLSAAEKAQIKAKSIQLEAVQDKVDSPEVLKTIPHLSRTDLTAKIETIDRTIQDVSGIPVLLHDLFTNGISYVDLAFPVDILSPSDYAWLPFFSRAMVSMGLPGLDYGEVSSLLAQTVGGFHAILETGSPVPGAAKAVPTPTGILDLLGRDWIIYRIKALDEKIADSIDLCFRLIKEADFSDLAHLRNLILEMKNDADSSLAPIGHSYVANRSERFISRSRAINEVWTGLSQLQFIHQALNLSDEEISRKCLSIRDTLVQRAGMIANICGSAAALTHTAKSLASAFKTFTPPKPRNPETMYLNSFLPSQDSLKGEVLSSASLQVGFAAQTLASSPYGSPEQAAELVLAHQLSTGALWESIRMKGGAYGAFAHVDNIEGAFSFATYRDPKPLRSLEAFDTLFKHPEKLQPDEETLVKAIIGVYAREITPRTSADKSFSDFLRFLYGIEDKHRAQRLERLVALQDSDIERVLTGLAKQTANRHPVILAGRSIAEKAAKELELDIQELPV
ncbi:insulinase family protein [Breznakiellaceae bacterium SP9]